MATTRLIPLHVKKGSSIAKCLKARTDYAENGEKTNNKELVSSYECDKASVDKEFLLTKKEYLKQGGHDYKGNVIAYQIRQAFKPGEVTPEEANRIGYETAMRWTKGKHAFIVATHVDRAHVHNHIIYNSTALDCTHKWRDFFRSGRALKRVSDIVCLENGLSVVDLSQKTEKRKYNKLLYSDRTGNQNKPLNHAESRDFNPVLDMQEIISKNKGANYERWAKRYNMKQVAKSICYLKEHGINSLSELVRITDETTKRFDELSLAIQEKQKMLETIAETKKQIAVFAKTRATYEAYRKAGYSKKFFENNREELQLHKAAKEYFDKLGIRKFPKIKDLSEEYGRILAAKRKESAEYKTVKESMQDLLVARQNVETILGSEYKETTEEKPLVR